jgi:hypothetical protein
VVHLLITSELVACHISQLEMGSYRLSLKLCDSFMIDVPGILLVYPPIIVDGYSPSQGPVIGGTRIYLRGRGFLVMQNDTLCRFSGTDSAPAHVVLCVHPHTGSPGTDVIIKFNQWIGFKENSSCIINNIYARETIEAPSSMMRCKVPIIINGNKVVYTISSTVSTILSISITFNGGDYHHTGFALHYSFEPQVYELDPSAGPRRGGNVVYVKGSNFDH